MSFHATSLHQNLAEKTCLVLLLLPGCVADTAHSLDSITLSRLRSLNTVVQDLHDKNYSFSRETTIESVLQSAVKENLLPAFHEEKLHLTRDGFGGAITLTVHQGRADVVDIVFSSHDGRFVGETRIDQKTGRIVSQSARKIR